MSYAYDECFIDALLFGEKQCPECGRTLPRTRAYFTVDTRAGDGFKAECNTCRRARQRTWYAATKETA